MGKTLIAYYSRRGENYVNGSIKNLKLGNTEVVAQKIKALLPDADVFQIDTTYEYSKSYMTCIEEAKQELHDNARPEVKNPLESIDQYDTIILGYPNRLHVPGVIQLHGQAHHPLLYQRGLRYGQLGALHQETLSGGNCGRRHTHSRRRGCQCRQRGS